MPVAKPDDLLARLAAVPYTGAISDILDEMGFTGQALPNTIQAIEPGQTVAGRAFTLLGEPSASVDPEVAIVPYLKMLGDVRAGDVLVSQPNDDRASHFGELSAETAQLRGACGAVIDGGVRDTSYIVRLGFPVFARYATPQDIVGRWRLADWNVRVTIGGVGIDPGDFVVGDRDGVLIIPRAIAGEVIARTEQLVNTENLVRKAVLEGVHPLEAYRRYGKF